MGGAGGGRSGKLCSGGEWAVLYILLSAVPEYADKYKTSTNIKVNSSGINCKANKILMLPNFSTVIRAFTM